MNTNSFLTTCFLLCFLLAGTTTSLSAQLRVLRPDGKLVLTTSSLRPRINVDTQGLAAGTYVVKLVDEHGKVENRQLVVR